MKFQEIIDHRAHFDKKYEAYYLYVVQITNYKTTHYFQESQYEIKLNECVKYRDKYYNVDKIEELELITIIHLTELDEIFSL